MTGSLDDNIIADDAVVINGNIGMYNTVITNYNIVTNKNTGLNNGSLADSSRIADQLCRWNKRAERFNNFYIYCTLLLLLFNIHTHMQRYFL